MTSTKIEKLNFRYKKSRLRDNLLFIFKMVPEARLELARLERRGILNPIISILKTTIYFNFNALQE